MFLSKRKPNGSANGKINDDGTLIKLRGVVKTFITPAGNFTALNGIDLDIGPGEFVSIIGKSGSGKTTLINMLTGIDHPTKGEIYIGGTAVHTLNEGQIATWRGTHLGVVFQFFQLLPTLTTLENVRLPMDFCNIYTRPERNERAMHLLELVGIAEHAHKLPNHLAGGQQQRAAIARALANDPPIIATDEPTGNLDSRTAESVMQLFQDLVTQGKTILMVTHDEDLARRAPRTIVLHDGEIVNEYVARALPTLSHELLLTATRQLETHTFAPGESIIVQDAEPEKFFIVTNGEAKVYLIEPGEYEVFMDTIHTGQYFGEMALIHGGKRTATVRAAGSSPVEVVALSKRAFDDLISQSEETRAELGRVAVERRQAQVEARQNIETH
jgi:ABC-type lipoprotein export system ATPase subunit